MSGDAGEVKVGVATKFTFAVKDEFGTLKSGLLDAAFTKTLHDGSGASAVTVTISERGTTGVYDAALTPNVTGEAWYLLVEHSSYGKWDGVFRVTARATDDLAYPATSGRSLAVSVAGAVDANLAAGAITSSTFAAGAIDAAAIATDAIGSAELAASAVTKIQTAVAAGAVASVTGAVGSVTGAVGSVTGAVGSVTGDVGGKVLGGGAGTITGTGARADVRAWNGTAPGNLVSGRVDVTVGAMQTDTLDANALKADAATEIAAAVSVPSAATIASAVANEALSGHTTAGTLGEAILRLRQAVVVGSGTLQSGSVLDASASSDDYAYRNGILLITEGTGAGQFTSIWTYNGTTKAFTSRTNFQGSVGDGTSKYVILAAPVYMLQANVSAMDNDVIGAAQIAADAIGASELAASAVSEIAAAISVPTANQNADALLDRAGALDGYTPREAGVLSLAALAGRDVGTLANPQYEAVDGSKVRLDATIAAGIRAAVTRDAT